VDGTGNPWFKADVGIEKGRITEMGDLHTVQADKLIDAGGLMVSPGFIDIHSHSDITLVVNGRAESKVRQGVTTEVNGNCGQSAAPMIGLVAEDGRRTMEGFGLQLDWATFEEYFNRLEKQGVSVNVASFVGHSNVRQAVIGNAERAPTDVELEDMSALVEQAMEEGAIGFSTGLEFAPQGYAHMDEIVELCKVVAKYGGVYATHQRNRDTHYELSTTEAIKIGERADVRVHLSHFVVRYPACDKTPTLLWMVDEARRKGVDVTFDVITPNDAPRELRLKLRDGYHWARSGLASQLIPPWGFEGGPEKTLGRCRDPKMREMFRKEHVPQWKVFGCPKGRFKILGTDYDFPDGVPPKWDRILLYECQASPELIGKSFDEIARIKGKDPWEAALDIVVAEIEETGGYAINILAAHTAERDSVTALEHPTASVTTDRMALAPYGPLGRLHSPNSYGGFARVFRKYVRERGIFTVEEAVRKMTSVAASSLRLYDRGIIRMGAHADIVVFDPERIADNATIEEPRLYAEGIEYVLVNGEVTVDKGEHTGTTAGQVLKTVRKGPCC